MYPYHEMLDAGASSATRFTLTYTHDERASWISLPPHLSGALFKAPLPLPLPIALHLLPAAPGLPRAPPVYGAWAGSSASAGCVGVPAALARSLQLAEGAAVSVVPLPDLPAAESVTLEPASPDDWEVVELNAEFIEEQLLNQAGVAATSQLLPLWIQGQVIALRVAATLPAGAAVRLVHGTEVLVAPRVRVRDQTQGMGSAIDGNRNIMERAGRDADASRPTAQAVAPLMRTALRLQVLPEPPPLDNGRGSKLPASVHKVYVAGATLERSGFQDGDWVRLQAPEGGTASACIIASASAAPGHMAACAAVVQALGAQQYDPIVLHALSDGQRDAVIEGALKSALAGAGPATPSAAAPQQIPPKAAPPSPAACSQEALVATLQAVLPVLASGPRSVLQGWGAPRPGGVLVTGPPGSGKTALARALCAGLAAHPQCLPSVEFISCREIRGDGPEAARAQLARHFAAALARVPALVVLDDLEVLCAGGGEVDGAGGPHADAGLVSWLCDVLDSLTAAAPAWRASLVQPGPGAWPPVAVVATCREAASLAAPLRLSGRLETVVTLPAPTVSSRAAMLEAGLHSRLAASDPAHLRAIAARADGYDGLDLGVLLDRALRAAVVRQAAADPSEAPAPGAAHKVVLLPEDLDAAMEGMVPAAFWGVGTRTSVTKGVEGWQDVGGLGEVRDALQEALELPIKHAALVARAPLRLRTGALLYGPPGCGKTHAVAAAVAAAGVRCITVSGPELLNKYIGASEAAVRDVFRRAAAAAPSVLFFDEFDAIAPQRGHDNTGVTDRVVNQLLTELDGVEGLRGVCVVAATSRPDLIDAALLRPGRLDRMLHCGFPSPKERGEVLAALSRRLQLGPDVDIQCIAEETEGFSGADLGALLSEAQLAAAHELLEAHEREGQAGGDQRPPVQQAPQVRARHLAAALASARPSVSAGERERLDAVYDPYLRGGVAPTAAEKGKGKKVSWA